MFHSVCYHQSPHTGFIVFHSVCFLVFSASIADGRGLLCSALVVERDIVKTGHHFSESTLQTTFYTCNTISTSVMRPDLR